VRTPARNYGPARLPGGASVTPLARRLASESQIDLTQLKGSGPHGRIIASDVQTAARVQPAAGAAMARGPSAADVMALYRDVPFEEIALDGMRKTIAARLIQAKQSIPHF
jgi:pyruvate dehydrogenase E2 component (dihydrolipoamide acetyltransferase)